MEVQKCVESLEIEVGLCFMHADRDALLCVCFGSLQRRATKFYSKYTGFLLWKFPADLLVVIPTAC
jgi:hypothetical protein